MAGYNLCRTVYGSRVSQGNPGKSFSAQSQIELLFNSLGIKRFFSEQGRRVNTKHGGRFKYRKPPVIAKQVGKTYVSGNAVAALFHAR